MTAGLLAMTLALACPVTKPNDRPLPGLYGNVHLAAPTYYPATQVSPRNVESNGWISEKFPWRAYGVMGDLKITGQRLDRWARPLRARISPGWPNERVSAFWAVGMLFPTTGCWRITGTVGSARLTFVTRVIDPFGYANRRRLEP